MKLTNELQISLSVAVSDAAQRRHEYASLEHLLYALLHDGETANVIRHSGGNIVALKAQLDTFLEKQVEALPEGATRKVQLTAAFERVLDRAANHVFGAGKDEVHGYNVLIAMYSEPDSWAVHLLEEQGVTRLDVVSYVSHGVSRARGETEDDSDTPLAFPAEQTDDPEADSDGKAKSGEGPLEAFTQNLNEQAARGAIDPLIGRDREIERLLHVLSRRRRNNALLVGDPGVGKTAIAEGLALRIHEGSVPDHFKNAEIFSLDMGSLLAGTRYRGDFENRVKAVLKALAKKPHAILVIDEIHTLVGAGAASGGAMDASNLLKPALSSGALRCIGMTTYEEYRNYFERDAALTRRFQKITVDEPSHDDTLKILEGLRTKYEIYHRVAYSRAALEAAIELSDRYLWQRRLPDKAIDLLDEAGAAARLAKRPKARIGRAEIEKTCATMAQIPPQRVSQSDRERLKTLEPDLKAVVFGQNDAITQLVAAIRMSRAGLRNPEKPIGSYLLTGPTGVGKTEVAKQLARLLDVEFIRFDMSEYMERHTVSRLIGAPPGYVGFDQGGLLTEAVTKTPHAVLLLDEIEKAHPDVFNLLLQVMDHGTLTDTNGRKTDFRHTILIMTSNVGAREADRERIGFGGGSQKTEEERAYKAMFSPEFRNRLDARITFAPLSPVIMNQIVDKFVGELVAQLGVKKVTIDLTNNARAWLAEKGYDRLYGARPMARVIQDDVKRPLADELLFGKLEHGGHVLIDADNGKLTFVITPREPAKPHAATEPQSTTP